MRRFASAGTAPAPTRQGTVTRTVTPTAAVTGAPTGAGGRANTARRAVPRLAVALALWAAFAASAAAGAASGSATSATPATATSATATSATANPAKAADSTVANVAPGTDTVPPAAGAAAAPPRQEALLWKVHDEASGGALYLLGSLHVLRPADLPLPAPVLDAYAASDVLVMELDLSAAAPGELERALQRYGQAAAGASLSTVAGDDWRGIARELRRLGIDPRAVEGFDPWFLATVILNQTLRELGFRADLGVEAQLLAQAQRDRRDTLGLETIPQQLAWFEGLSSQAQLAMLADTFAELDTLDEATARTIRAWRSGDTDVLRAELLAPMLEVPEIHQALVIRRNAAWTARIEELLATAPVELVVVGALHLLGENSLVDLLDGREDVTLRPVW